MPFIIALMELHRLLVVLFAVILFGCSAFSPPTVIVIDGDSTITVTTNETLPILILAEAGITPQPDDRVLVNGIPHELDDEIAMRGNFQMQLRRAVNVRLLTPDGEQTINTSALTVGEVLNEAEFTIHINDDVAPPLTAPITDSLTIHISPTRELTVTSGGESVMIHSSANTVGEALAKAGIPLMGLDQSIPSENEPLPPDGRIQVTRISESVFVQLESIPFSVEETFSEDVVFGQQEILQYGANGLTMIRTRVRYEDGVVVSRKDEEKTILREPKTQLVLSGSKITLSPVGGNSQYQYWYATEMYASWYSPCNSGTGGCSYGTASGARAGYGIVAVDYSIYPYLAGMKVYIPGYGLAVIGDTGGGPIIESAFGVARTQWIDLGYDDNNIGGLSGWVTVYFLEPAPAEIPYFFK